MKCFIVKLFLFYFLPFIVNFFFNLSFYITLFYSLILIIFLIIFIKLLLKKHTDLYWPNSIANYGLFNLCCSYLSLNYYSQELPPLFEKADVLYHIIYSDILKGLVVSIIATIIFTWYSEYRNFSKNFFLFLYLEYYIKELWTFLYNMEYQAYKNYMDLSIENIVELTEQIDQTSIKIEWDESSLNKLNKINNEIEKIFLYMYTPVNQDIYYLIKSIDFIIDNHMFKENITISLSERIIAILKGLESFKKNPINSIIE